MLAMSLVYAANIRQVGEYAETSFFQSSSLIAASYYIFVIEAMLAARFESETFTESTFEVGLVKRFVSPCSLRCLCNDPEELGEC
jgi:hypothetical protein